MCAERDGEMYMQLVMGFVNGRGRGNVYVTGKTDKTKVDCIESQSQREESVCATVSGN